MQVVIYGRYEQMDRTKDRSATNKAIQEQRKKVQVYVSLCKFLFVKVINQI